jgi:WD40 repeat protein
VLQVWNIASLLEGGPKKQKLKAGSSSEEGVVALRTICAVAAHDKDLNQLAVSPNDALIASASQDKTVKVRPWCFCWPFALLV